MVDTRAKPQILEHLSKSLNLTIYDTKCASAMPAF